MATRTAATPPASKIFLRDQRRTFPDLPNVRHHLHRPRERHHRRLGLQARTASFEYASRLCFLRLRIPLFGFSSDRRLGQRSIRRAESAHDFGVIWGGATLLTGLVGSTLTIIAARVLLGFGEGATFPTATRAMSDWIAQRQARTEPGHHALERATWQRANSSVSRLADCARHVARIVHHSWNRQRRLGDPLVALLPR